MAREEVNQYVVNCDRCKVEVFRGDEDDFDGSALTTINNEDSGDEWELCEKCAHLHERFMGNTPASEL